MAVDERLIMDNMLDDDFLEGTLMDDEDTIYMDDQGPLSESAPLSGGQRVFTRRTMPRGIAVDRSSGEVLSHGGYTNAPEYGPRTVEEARELGAEIDKMDMNRLSDQNPIPRELALQVAARLDNETPMLGIPTQSESFPDRLTDDAYAFLLAPNRLANELLGTNMPDRIENPSWVSHGILSPDHGLIDYGKLRDNTNYVLNLPSVPIEAARDYISEKPGELMLKDVFGTGLDISSKKAAEAHVKGFNYRTDEDRYSDDRPIKKHLVNPVTKQKIPGSEFEIPNTWYGRMLSDFSSWLEY